MELLTLPDISDEELMEGIAAIVAEGGADLDTLQ